MIFGSTSVYPLANAIVSPSMFGITHRTNLNFQFVPVLRAVANTYMKKFGKVILPAICFAMIATIVPVRASYDVEYELLRSRDALLKQQDDLAKTYDDLMRTSFDLNRQLVYVDQRIKSVSDDMRRTDSTLRDVEYSLRNTR